jgi:Fic family protein
MKIPTGLPDITRRIETDRFGPFAFRLGVDFDELRMPLQRVEDAHVRFIASPLAQVASQLEREVIVSSIFGTNTIEGGTLTEDETESALALDPALVQEVEQRRAVNIKLAYDAAQTAAATPDWHLDESFIFKLHGLITQDVPHLDNRPGLIRDNSKHRMTCVGDEAHGGRYKPPQFDGDIHLVLGALIEWHSDMVAAGIPALIRAPLVHLYFEQIHPFWDGNGRVGRVIEATVLRAAGYRYAPFALARYYLTNIDHYFTLFNTCRKAAKKHAPAPNQGFIAFHLEGMRQTIDLLHARVDRLVTLLLYASDLRRAYDEKHINARQYTIASHVLNVGRPLPLDELRRSPWYSSLYLKLNDKTRQRDLLKLRSLGFVHLDTAYALWPGAATGLSGIA